MLTSVKIREEKLNSFNFYKLIFFFPSSSSLVSKMEALSVHTVEKHWNLPFEGKVYALVLCAACWSSNDEV